MKTLFATFLFFFSIIFAQAQSDAIIEKKDSVVPIDITDVIHTVFNPHKKGITRIENKKKYQFSLLPIAGYSLQTGLAAVLTANVAFYQSNDASQKISSISTNFTYSQYDQIMVPVVIDFWNKKNKINFISDNRYLRYPSSIYGLGGKKISIDANSNTAYTINFSGLKLHQSVLFSVTKNLYLGGGFYYDQFWNIKALDDQKKNIVYLLRKDLGTKEVATGPAIRLIYDSRINQINANNGLYANVQYRNSFNFLGSTQQWATLFSEARAYVPFPKKSSNVFAFWAFSWLTLSKAAPSYLLLPSTGWDDQYNSGRGYIQSRFRGRDMYYYENEYRFSVSKNGLFGGVVFGNAQLFSADLSKQFNAVNIGYGLGVRVRFNKHSKTNLCLDYGFGNGGSKGLFVNLGEVF